MFLRTWAMERASSRVRRSCHLYGSAFSRSPLVLLVALMVYVVIFLCVLEQAGCHNTRISAPWKRKLRFSLFDGAVIDRRTLPVTNHDLSADARNVSRDDVQPTGARWIDFPVWRARDGERVFIFGYRHKIYKPRVGMCRVCHVRKVHQRNCIPHAVSCTTSTPERK